MERVARSKMFDGFVETYQHESRATSCAMRFSVFVPPQASAGRVPVVYWLSGLTCSEENFTVKAGAQRYASELGLLLVAPDTSPRGPGVPDAPGESDLGIGAGFYVDATEEPWRRHYRMYTYVTEELPRLIQSQFPADTARQSIMGHSMGGHGALVVGLRERTLYRSVSAFAPIVSPTLVPWGQKAFASYLGQSRSAWEPYDAHILLRRAKPPFPILIDQGDADPFLDRQLQPERLQEAAREVGADVELRLQPGYDHSYFFVASFMGDHLAFHARHLRSE